MRWDRLFDDLEAQLRQEQRAAERGEIADLTRAERAEVTWLDRAARSLGRPVALHTPAGRIRGELQDVGVDWLLVDEAGRRPAVVPAAAVSSIGGLSGRNESVARGRRRIGVGHAVRAISRDRAPVAVHTLDRQLVTGTIDLVGSDYLELAEHPADAVRRAGEITGRRVVPFAAVAVLRRA